MKESSNFNQEQSSGQEKAVTPEHSPETEELINRLGERIQESEAFSAGLGKVAKEEIFSGDREAFDEIYIKEVGRGKLNSHEDAEAFESAGDSLRVRNLLKRVMTLGMAGSKYAMKGQQGIIDTRNLKEDVKQKMSNKSAGYDLSQSEAAEAVEKAGLKTGEMYIKRYEEGKRGAEKVYLGKKTEQEQNIAASDILARRLKDLETKTGTDLIKQKQSLEEFDRETKQNKEILEKEGLLDKLGDERRERNGKIESDQQALNDSLEVFRSPLIERQRSIEQPLGAFSELLAGLNSQEAAYRQKIKDFEDKIRKIGGTKQLAISLGDKISEWKEQKVQVETNLKDIKAKKDALNQRILSLKKGKIEVDNTLARINKIGKTPAELRKELEEKQQAEKAKGQTKKTKEELPTEPGASGNWQANAPAGSPTPKKARRVIRRRGTESESTGFEVPIKYVTQSAGKEPTAQKAGTEGASESDSLVEHEAAEQARRASWINKIDQLANKETEGSTPADTDDYDDLAAAERRRIEIDQGRVQPEASVEEAKGGWFGRAVTRWFKPGREIERKRFKPERGMGEPKKQPGTEAVAAVASAKERLAPEQMSEGEGTEKRETKIVRPIRFWLNAIFEDRLSLKREEIMKKHFKIKEIKDKNELSREITSEQAQKAYAGYTIELIKLKIIEPRDAWSKAAKVVKNIVKNIDEYDSRERETDEKSDQGPEGNVGTAETESGQPETKAEALPPEARQWTDNLKQRMEKDRIKIQREPAGGNRAARKIRKKELDEAALKEEARARGGIGITKKAERAPYYKDKEAKPLNGLGVALEQAGSLDNKKAEKPADTAGPVETAAGHAPIIESGASNLEPADREKQEKAGEPEKAETRLSTKKLLELLDLKVNDAVKARFISPENKNRKFNKKDLWTEDQALAVGVAHLMAVSKIPEGEARKQIEKILAGNK